MHRKGQLGKSPSDLNVVEYDASEPGRLIRAHPFSSMRIAFGIDATNDSTTDSTVAYFEARVRGRNTLLEPLTQMQSRTDEWFSAIREARKDLRRQKTTRGGWRGEARDDEVQGGAPELPATIDERSA